MCGMYIAVFLVQVQACTCENEEEVLNSEHEKKRNQSSTGCRGQG